MTFRHLAGSATVGCLACLFLLTSRSAAADAFFDYLYIEASSGSSAGGHAAVRFGEAVYHFQHDRPGILRAATDSWTRFDLSYRGIENRPIHVQRIAVSPSTYERLRSSFHRRYIVQESHVHLLDALRRERELLACLANPERSRLLPCQVRLPGIGYFFASPRDPPDAMGRSISPSVSVVDAGAAAIAEARHRVERAYGGDYLDRQIETLRGRIESLRPTDADIEMPRAGIVATRQNLFADRYRNLLLELLALRVLAGQTPAVASAFRVLPGTLSDKHRESLEQREERVRQSIVALLASSRADRGYPLAIALARLVAFRASSESGRLVVLDTYADDAPTTRLTTSLRQLPALLEIQEERWQEMQGAFDTAVAASANDEASWSRFEVAANVALELEGAAKGIRDLRTHQLALAPARGAQMQADWPEPRLDTAAAAAMDRAQGLERRIGRRLHALYLYDLMRRNCVTEIFRTIDDTESVDTDLGRVQVDGNVNFIPFVSAKAVDESYPVAERIVLPSYREQQLLKLRASPDRLLDVMREETSLTSTVVPFSVEDEVFLFFSNGSTLLRPLLGTANVAFGAGGILAGAFSAPFDGGTLFAAGARGILYSLPELAFVNIRKGTVPLLPSTWDAASVVSGGSP